MADENLTNALNNINQASGAAQQLAEMLQAASRSSARQTSATDVARDSMREFDRAQNGVRNGMMSMVGTLQSLAGSLVSVGASAYTADKAFTAMVPALDAMGTALKGTFDALGKAGSGVSAFGFSFGQSSEGVAAAAKLYVDVIQGALRFQLEAAQQVTDRFLELSNVGAVFGGGLTELKAILDGFEVLNEVGEKVKSGIGLPLLEFTRIVTQNAEAISNLGLGMRNGGLAVASFGKKIYDSNTGLAALYGSVTELSKGTAHYLSLQAQLGVNVTRDVETQNRARRGAEEYLLRMKELSSITGKNAETLRREEEGRRKQIDYNLKLGRLGDDAQKNVQEGMAIAGKVFGDAGAKYAEEYFATGGKVFTKEALTYQAMNQEAAQTIENMLSGIDQSRDAFRENAKKTFQQAAPALEAYAASMEEYANINRAANNSVIKGMTDTASAIQQSLPFLQNMGEIFKQLKIDRDKISEGLDEPLKVFVQANKDMMTNRMQMDTIVLENMTKMREVVKALYETQLAFIRSQPDAIDAFNKLKQAGNDTNQILREFGTRLANMMGFNAQGTVPNRNSNTAPPSAANVVPPQNIPGLNSGDVATRPSPFSGQNPQLQPETQSPGTTNTDTTNTPPVQRTPQSDKRSQALGDKEVVAVLSTLPTKIDAERMNRDVIDALQKLTNAVA